MNIIEMRAARWEPKQVAEYALEALKRQGCRAGSDAGVTIYPYKDRWGYKCGVGVLLPNDSPIFGMDGGIMGILATTTLLSVEEYDALNCYKDTLQQLQIFHDSPQQAKETCTDLRLWFKDTFLDTLQEDLG